MMPELEEQQRQEKLHQDQVQAAKQALDEVEAKKPRLDGKGCKGLRAQLVLPLRVCEPAHQPCCAVTRVVVPTVQGPHALL